MTINLFQYLTKAESKLFDLVQIAYRLFRAVDISLLQRRTRRGLDCQRDFC